MIEDPHGGLEEEQEKNMYLDPKVALAFAELEAAPENKVYPADAAKVDAVVMEETASLRDPLIVADLGAGAHPGLCHRKLFARLLESNPPGHIDWVDSSPSMLEFARKSLQKPEYQARQRVTTLIKKDILDYLCGISDNTLDLVIMKYTLNYLPAHDVNILFQLLAEALKPGGRFVATVSSLSGELIGLTPNVRFVYQGKEIPPGETRTMNPAGDSYGLKFLRTFNKPEDGYLPGAETTIFYHPRSRLKQLAHNYGFDDFHLGNWKELVPQAEEEGGLDVLVLRKHA